MRRMRKRYHNVHTGGGAPPRPGRDRVPAGDVEHDSWSDDDDDRAAGRPPSRAVDSGAGETTPLPAIGRETAVAVSVCTLW